MAQAPPLAPPRARALQPGPVLQPRRALRLSPALQLKRAPRPQQAPHPGARTLAARPLAEPAPRLLVTPAREPGLAQALVPHPGLVHGLQPARAALVLIRALAGLDLKPRRLKVREPKLREPNLQTRRPAPRAAASRAASPRAAASSRVARSARALVSRLRMLNPPRLFASTWF